jgi:LPS-assembly lipoprotein
MSSPNRRTLFASSLRLAAGLGAAALVGGCFQPLYGERTLDGGPSIKAALQQVEVDQIPAPNGTAEARIAMEVRNALLFDLQGASPLPATHRLSIRISSSRASIIVDTKTARPDVENYGLTATYTLIDMQTGKTVISAQTFTRVSYDIPGQEQRFARQRALREAETRAAHVIASNIKSRLASYFVAGT